MSQYLADSPPTVVKLEAKLHFNKLSETEKLYAHWMSRATFFGSRIVLRQVSPESEGIYDLIIALHQSCGGDWKQLQEETGVPREDVDEFLSYAAQFLGNLGNYKGFGNSKFIPRISQEALKNLVSKDEKAKVLFKKLKGGIFGTEPPALMHLGFPEQGHLSTYYPDSPAITKQDIDLISSVMGKNGLLLENTRLKKMPNGDFQALIASGISHPPVDQLDAPNGQTSFPIPDPEPNPEGSRTLHLFYGDHREELAKVALAIKKASHFAANPTQKSMLDAYATSFGTGSLKAFKTSQEHWVKDIGPAVETNIGFVETYRDPAGVRGEWEGFVAMVNKDRTAIFGRLVSAASRLIPALPWPKAFEKDVFTPPDFTSLEVLSFPSSGIPVGINIPNYDDIRQNIGFKNVSLGNVLGAKSPNERIPFIHDDDLETYKKHKDSSFEVQVGIHELLGHGTGKLLQETSPGVFNFDHTNPPINPVTNAPIKTWYKPNETWSSVFGPLSSSYEECRAECVAMYLACSFEILSLFGLDIGSTKPTSNPSSNHSSSSTTESSKDPYQNVDTSSEAFKVLHTAYLSMARAGLAALEFWDPKANKWGQAHMQARFSILQCFLAASSSPSSSSPSSPSPSSSSSSAGDKPFCTLTPSPGTPASAEDLDNLTVRIDPHQILTTGRKAVGAYLTKLHVAKSTADLEAGRELYAAMTAVREREHGEWWAEGLRGVVIKKKVPRKVFVMGNTVVEGEGDGKGGKVELREYETTREGLIASWAERGV